MDYTLVHRGGENMFIGEFNHTVDIKGRISMPSKFREKIGEVFYITKGLDDCLFVFPKDEWEIFENKLKTLPLTNKSARTFVRLFFSGATECSLDKQGRMLLPQSLRDHGSIVKDAVLIGVGTRIEIWSKDVWEDYNNPDNISYDEIAEQMAELGI